MKFLDIFQRAFIEGDYIDELCSFNKGYENPKVLFFGEVPEDRVEEEFNLSKLTDSDLETIVKVITGGVSCRIYDKGLTNRELLILDNVYAACCTYAINHLDIQERLFPYGLLTIESDTQAYHDLQTTGDIIEKFQGLGMQAEDRHNKRLRKIWQNFDKNVRIIFDMPNVELINRKLEQGYKPFINYNTFSFGLLSWYRLQELSGRDLIKDDNNEKTYLSNRIMWFEKSVKKGKAILDESQTEFLETKIEDIRERYNL